MMVVHRFEGNNLHLRHTVINKSSPFFVNDLRKSVMNAPALGLQGSSG
jgi:hypothetical protein